MILFYSFLFLFIMIKVTSFICRQWRGFQWSGGGVRVPLPVPGGKRKGTSSPTPSDVRFHHLHLPLFTQDFCAAVEVGQMLVEKNKQLMEAAEQSSHQDQVNLLTLAQ